jgi:hypothetical protein
MLRSEPVPFFNGLLSQELARAVRFNDNVTGRFREFLPKKNAGTITLAEESNLKKTFVPVIFFF